MKKYYVAVPVILGACIAVHAFQTPEARVKVIPTQNVLDNAQVTIERNVLEPGESTPILTHTLPHVTVVIQGSTIHIVNANGTATDKVRPAGFVAYDVPSGKPNPHAVINAGTQNSKCSPSNLRTSKANAQPGAVRPAVNESKESRDEVK